VLNLRVIIAQGRRHHFIRRDRDDVDEKIGVDAHIDNELQLGLCDDEQVD